MNEDSHVFEASIRGNDWVISCERQMESAEASKLRRTIAWCLSTSALGIELDLSSVEHLGRETLSVILNGMVAARENGVVVSIRASAQARRSFDEAGLWWVGIVDDGISAELAMGDAFQNFVEEHRSDPGPF